MAGVKSKNKGDTVCVYFGAARRAVLMERARRLGYTSFSEYLAVCADTAPEVRADELPQLKARATLDGVTLAEVVRDRV